MKRYLNYCKVVIAHRFWAFVYCDRLGVSLLGIVHDISKWYPSEFVPYAHNFFNADGTKRTVRDKSGAYDPAAQPDQFQYAWLHHQRNRHHWQAWILIGDGGKLEALEMPSKYIKEMVADWMAAGRVYSGKAEPWNWYRANSDRMILHPQTRKTVEWILDCLELSGQRNHKGASNEPTE